MSAAIIDRSTLNSLFDNQKKMDDLFDSIFNDDHCVFVANSWQTGNDYAAPCAKTTSAPNHGLSASLLAVKAHHPYAFMVPIVLEIAIISFVVTHFL